MHGASLCLQINYNTWSKETAAAYKYFLDANIDLLMG